MEDKKRAGAVESGKAKEECLKVAGARCWNGILLKCLKKTGATFICLSHEVVSIVG